MRNRWWMSLFWASFLAFIHMTWLTWPNTWVMPYQNGNSGNEWLKRLACIEMLMHCLTLGRWDKGGHVGISGIGLWQVKRECNIIFLWFLSRSLDTFVTWLKLLPIKAKKVEVDLYCTGPGNSFLVAWIRLECCNDLITWFPFFSPVVIWNISGRRARASDGLVDVHI